ncbi:MAG: hypothetical protein ACOH2V_00915 [Candidatus Saccharimonadaceae bacterium]
MVQAIVQKFLWENFGYGETDLVDQLTDYIHEQMEEAFIRGQRKMERSVPSITTQNSTEVPAFKCY